MNGSRIAVVGLGADGWPGLGETARAAILSADEIVGSRRQLDLLPAHAPAGRVWPSPIDPLVDELAERRDGVVCVLASGDPMLHGIGATLARRVGLERLSIVPYPSAFALVCARLGWPAADVELVSTVARSPDVVARILQPGRRVVVYATGTDGAAAVARVLCHHGFGPSRLVVLEQLGGAGERIVENTAAGWGDRPTDPLHAIAIECTPSRDAPLRALVPGLPDDAYQSDGQLTKRHVRAATVAGLAPTPGALLWDVGAGSGSIAIEWLRVERSARAIAIERRADRAERIGVNARALGVPCLEVVRGDAPAALDGLARPEAVFIGGGIMVPELLERCWEKLLPGGRIVANAVTLEGEHALIAAREAYGGGLVRIEISHAEPIGGFTGWRAQMPVVQWSSRKGAP
ncbi:MAG: precorrin-6y C5,15-methyltransferase (decarboxylating) subunit CbiE [Actinobacteria bacterium]|nr:precorrin-6y C5,15-methyltransferase (decarboxylating) subunit CbiE [Actinomycetota bacterium]